MKLPFEPSKREPKELREIAVARVREENRKINLENRTKQVKKRIEALLAVHKIGEIELSYFYKTGIVLMELVNNNTQEVELGIGLVITCGDRNYVVVPVFTENLDETTPFYYGVMAYSSSNLEEQEKTSVVFLNPDTNDTSDPFVFYNFRKAGGMMDQMNVFSPIPYDIKGNVAKDLEGYIETSLDWAFRLAGES